MPLVETLKLEGRLVYKSRWAWGLIVALLLVLMFASISSYGLAKPSQRTLQMTKKIQGANYKRWILKDDGAKDIRAQVQTIHPNMGANLFTAFFGVIGPLLLIVFGASAVGGEFGQRTVKIRAAHHGWAQTIRAKAVLIILLNVSLIGFVVIAGIGANRIIWHFALKSIDISSWIKSPIVNYSLAKQFFVLMFGLSFYGLLGALLALVARSTAAGIVMSIGIPYVEQYVGLWWLPQSSYGYLLGKHVVYAAGGLIAPPPGALAPPVSWYPWLILLAWNLLALVGLSLVPKMQEI